MAGVFAIFLGFAASLLSAVSGFVSYLVIRETDDESFATSLVFVVAVSVFLFLGSLMYTLKLSFGAERFLGLEIGMGMPLLLLFAVLCVNGIIWQIVEQSGIDLK